MGQLPSVIRFERNEDRATAERIGPTPVPSIRYHDDYNSKEVSMLDTFRKRDNVRPTGGNAPGVRPGTPNLAHAPGATAPTAPSRNEPTSSKAALLEPNPLSSEAALAREPDVGAAPAPGRPEPAPSVARLTVGPDIKLKGAEITDCDTLIVEGQVDASMDSRVVEIAESGIFRGKVQVEVADIRGRFDGELTALKQLVIRETGRVSGTIRYGKIRIDEGGTVSGDVAATGAEAAVLTPPARPLEAARK
jgi:cytoskeletal protein CcmA (bactofilin family)